MLLEDARGVGTMEFSEPCPFCRARYAYCVGDTVQSGVLSVAASGLRVEVGAALIAPASAEAVWLPPLFETTIPEKER
jgi:hypothetical protein